jgi:hypothetical protein
VRLVEHVSRRQRQKFAAQMETRIAAENASVPGLEEWALANGWTGTDAPELGVEDAEGCICRVALGIHSVSDIDKTRRQRFRQLFLSPSELGPTYSQYQAPRVVHCYRGDADSRQVLVGSAFYDIQFFMGSAAAYGKTTPPPEELSSGFCVVRIPTTGQWLQLIPAIKGWLSRGKDGLGYADLDARYAAYCPDRQLARRTVGPEIASLVASREDWGLSINGSVLACVTRDPLSSGSDAEQLVAATVRIAELMQKTEQRS